jgi:hypothetical protein
MSRLIVCNRDKIDALCQVSFLNLKISAENKIYHDKLNLLKHNVPNIRQVVQSSSQFFCFMFYVHIKFFSVTYLLT